MVWPRQHQELGRVLKFAYRISEFDNALGLSGPEDPHDKILHSGLNNPATPNVFMANCKRHIRKHGAYKRSSPIYAYISAHLKGDTPNHYVTL